MKLKSLRVKQAFGYLDFNVNLKKNLTFLVGINGSGKTTALRLIEALTVPSLQQLDKILHEQADLRLHDGERPIRIISKVTAEYTNITVIGIDGVTELSYGKPELDVTGGTSSDSITEFYRSLYIQFASHPVFQYLRTVLDTPLFLGLERRNVTPMFAAEDKRGNMSFDARRREVFLMSARRKMPVSGQLGSSLIDVQFWIQEIYRKRRAEQEKFADRLREQMFLNAFDFQPTSGFFKTLRHGNATGSFLHKIVERRADVESALKDAGLAHEKFGPVVNKFFRHIEELTRKVVERPENSDFDDIAVELAFNRPVVDRVIRLIATSEEYNASIKKLWSPITDFLRLVNRFLSDSGKTLDIDQVGWLFVKVPGADLPRTLDVLSSGERQIVVILGHLAINRELNRAGIFVVDEPELSLHLRWQQIFVDSLLEASPNNQFILATHAPAIVMERSNLCVSFDKRERVTGDSDYAINESEGE